MREQRTVNTAVDPCEGELAGDSSGACWALCCSPRRKTDIDQASRTIYIDIRRYTAFSDSIVHLVYHQDIISASGYAAGVPYVQGSLAR